MKKHLMYAVCALVLIGMAAVLPAAADGAGEFGPAFEGSVHMNIATDPIPAIEIQTLTNGQDADTPPGPSVPVGSTVTWTYVVTNTGNVALTNVQITDDQGVTVTAPKTTLAPGESMTATASGTAQTGQYANVGTVTGTPPTGPTLTASDPSHYFGSDPPTFPVAQFHASPRTGVDPVSASITFTDDSAGDGITNWFWDFGDGETSTDQNPIHIYRGGSLFTVSLTVTNAAGSDTEVKADYLKLGTPLPIARFEANVTSGTAPLAVRFTDTSDYYGEDAAARRLWDFGDGATSTEQDPVHVYAAAGNFTVTLTATTVGSDSEVKADYITVTAPPITGADRGFFLVSTVPAGAEIYLEGLGGTRYHQGNTSAGPLNVTLCLTCTPMRRIVANLSGYRDAAWNIPQYPAKGETVPVDLTLEPIATPTPTPVPYRPNAIPGRIEAENYDLGGEGVAYHDTTPGNAGGLYRTDDVDVERFSAEGSPSVGWIRSSEWLTYTATVAQSGTYTLRARVASPYSGRKAYLSVDGAPKATIAIPYTGSFATFATVQVPLTLTAGTRVLKVYFSGDGQNLNWLDFASGTVTTPTTPPSGTASFTAAPLTAPRGTAVKFTLTPRAGKTVKSVWWSFDTTAHMNTWNSRAVNPTFFYPRTGTFSPLVKITYTDNSVEEVRRANYVRAT